MSATGSPASATYNLDRNKVYKWKVRANNCGTTPGPWSTLGSFTVR
jgi:hypothetical protein